jgi:mersacidin/lichenicidin family type 2 lantibiotic
MPPVSIILAWKDAEYRKSLSTKEKAQLPTHPVQLVDLLDEQHDAGAFAIGSEHNANWAAESHAQ